MSALVARAGGKILLYHGWADQPIPPFGTVSYRAGNPAGEAGGGRRGWAPAPGPCAVSRSGVSAALEYPGRQPDPGPSPQSMAARPATSG